jgi:hypothetical protein
MWTAQRCQQAGRISLGHTLAYCSSGLTVTRYALSGSVLEPTL